MGIRCTTSSLAVAVVEGTRQVPALVSEQEIRFPKKVSGPALLAWIRKEVQDLIRTHAPEAVILKGPETFPRAPSRERLEIEAIVQEAAFSAGVADVTVLNKAQLKKALNTDEPARYVSRFASALVEGEERREAVTAAATALT